MKSLQNWGFMGDVRINSGFYWGSNTGIYYDILGRVGGRLAGGGEGPCARLWEHAYLAGDSL